MLNDYLRKLCHIEKNKYLLYQLEKNERERLDRIETELVKMKEEKRDKVPEVVYPPSKEEPPAYVLWFIAGLLIGGIVAVIIWFLLAAIIVLFSWGEPGESISSFMEGMMIAILGIADIIFASWIVQCQADGYEKYLRTVENTKLLNEQKENEYKIWGTETDRMIKILSEEKENSKKNIEYLQMKIYEVNSTLTDYYELNIIYGKYWNMEAVCKLLEYLQSGRCNTLYGPSGAYDTYEKEYRTEIMIEKLDAILYKLEEIKKVNIILCQTMQQIQVSLNEIYRGMNEQQTMLSSISESLGRGIGIIEENLAANKLMKEITESNLYDIMELGNYRNFVMKQERLNQGHWY